ncbi:MAG: hypothetical protein GX783_11790 [Clostridiales bacterium]|nr:hypothetical protein [Clostridiales bacterium]
MTIAFEIEDRTIMEARNSSKSQQIITNILEDTRIEFRRLWLYARGNFNT